MNESQVVEAQNIHSYDINNYTLTVNIELHLAKQRPSTTPLYQVYMYSSSVKGLRDLFCELEVY